MEYSEKDEAAIETTESFMLLLCFCARLYEQSDQSAVDETSESVSILLRRIVWGTLMQLFGNERILLLSPSLIDSVDGFGGTITKEKSPLAALLLRLLAADMVSTE